MVEISTGLVTKVWNKNPKHYGFCKYDENDMQS